jgi:hypothetical protein
MKSETLLNFFVSNSWVSLFTTMSFALSLGEAEYLAIADFGKLYLKSDNFIIHTFFVKLIKGKRVFNPLAVTSLIFF